MPKRQKQEDSQTNAASFRLRDVTISMERTSQPEGVRFTIEQREGANSNGLLFVADGRITEKENGTTLSLGWSEDVTVSEMKKLTEGDGFARIVIAKSTSK